MGIFHCWMLHRVRPRASIPSSNSHYGNGQSLHALTVVETSQTRSGNEPQYRFLCLVGARHLEGLYPFHLSQVSCSKLMAFPEALYLVIEALDESAQRRWRVAVEVRYTCIVGLRRSLARNGRDNFRSIRSATIMRIADILVLHVAPCAGGQQCPAGRDEAVVSVLFRCSEWRIWKIRTGADLKAELLRRVRNSCARGDNPPVVC